MIGWGLNWLAHAAWLCGALYLWNSGGFEKVNFDSLSLSISVFQTVLAVFALIGFGYFKVVAERAAKATAAETAKSVATEAAADEARKVARETAERIVKAEMPAMVRREYLDQAETGAILGEGPMKADAQKALNSLDGDKADDPV